MNTRNISTGFWRTRDTHLKCKKRTLILESFKPIHQAYLASKIGTLNNMEIRETSSTNREFLFYILL